MGRPSARQRRVVASRDVHADARAGAALVRHRGQPARGVRVQRGQDQLARGGEVVGRAGTHVGDSQRKAGRAGEHLQPAAEGPVSTVVQVMPMVDAGSDPIGGHQGGVQAGEGQFGGAGVGQYGLGQTVAQPAQNENDLVVHRAGPLRRPGTGTAAMPAIQPVTDFLDTGVGTSEAAR